MLEEKPTPPPWWGTALLWLQRVLRPPLAVGLPVVVGGFALVAVVFATGLTKTPLAYGSYVLSAYALAITLAAVVRQVPKTCKAMARFVESHERLARVRHSRVLRMRLALDGSCVVNVAFGAYMGYVGFTAESVWYGSLGLYYLVVAAARLVLTRTVHDGLGSRAREVRAFRACAVLVLVLDLALGAMAVQMVLEGRQVTYEGYLIYVAAIYTFYSVGAALANVLHARATDGPVEQAVRALGVCTALVAVLSLQTAMFASFDTNGDAGEVQTIMNAVTALCVCTAVAVVGIAMVHKGRRMHRELETEEGRDGRC